MHNGDSSWEDVCAELEQVRTVASQERALREGRERELTKRLADREVELAYYREQLRSAGATERELKLARQQLARFELSITWQLFQGARGRLFSAIGGQHGMPVRALQAALRLVGRLHRVRSPVPEPIALTERDHQVELPKFTQPDVSLIIVPSADGAHLRACLESIRDNTHGPSYEVVLTQSAPRAGKGEGYAPAYAEAASRARGRWLALCTEDVEVQHDWLNRLLECVTAQPDIGIVTPKYLRPDGRLSEAGAIVWRDGTATRYGNGDSPSDHKYEFRRETDCGSVGALLVQADFWRVVGGFDESFSTLAQQTADLCFRAREHGLRVIYEPRAVALRGSQLFSEPELTPAGGPQAAADRWRLTSRWWRQLAEGHPHRTTDLERGANRDRRLHVLIVDHRVPMWDRDSGSLRMLGIIQQLLALECRVTFFPDNLHPISPYTEALRALGVDVWSGPLDVTAQLSGIGRGLGLVLTSRPHATSRWLDLIKELAPFAPIVYDTVDLHWLREARRGAQAFGEPLTALSPRATVLRELELALIRTTDATLVVTEEERDQVLADVPEATVRVIPNVNEVRSLAPPANCRHGVLFIGGFEHPPNVDAALRLVREVMPQVWSELGDVPVSIVGADAPKEIRLLASPLVNVTGWVRDVQPLLDSARALVAPFTYGAGLKGKVTQALAAGLPVVTNSIGAQGLEAVDGEQMLIAETDTEFARRVVKVLTDDHLWNMLSRNGQRLAQARCSPDVVRQRLAALLSTLRQPAEDAPVGVLGRPDAWSQR